MRVHDSQAYRKMDLTRERISRVYKTGIAALSVAIPCASQKIVKCMIWAVHKTGSRGVSEGVLQLSVCLFISNSCPP